MRTLLTPALLLLSLNAFAQAPLPTHANFDDPLPGGWSESLQAGNTRYVDGQVGAACRLDQTHDHVTVHFGDVAGPVTYWIKGQTSSGGTFNDTFTIQESADGANWTTLRQLGGSGINNNSFVMHTDQPLATSRHLRWYFTQKVSGRNIALDEISIQPQTLTDAQEINLYAGSSPVFIGSTFTIGNSASTVLTIENFNLPSGSALNISSMTITGQHASDFSISGVTAPFDVAAAGTQDFTIHFAPGANGSRLATLTIMNNDANGDETAYVVHLYGIGGSLATEPTAGATNLSFSNVTSYGMNVSFQAGSPAAEKYLVLRGVADAAFLGQPVDGQTYVKGDYINDWTQVVHVGPPATFRPRHVIAGSDYHYNVYAFNGPSGYENYLMSDVLMGSSATPATMEGSYFSGIDPTSSSFPEALKGRISNPYSQVFYGNYASVMLEKFTIRDTTAGQKVITDAYAGYQHVFSGAFFYDVMSREHCHPHSWMPTYPSQDGLEYSDMHNLFPVHQNSVNAVRSNLPFGNVVNVASTFHDGKRGMDANGNSVYEPRDQYKGDAARAIFYMIAKWNGTGGAWSLPEFIGSLVPYGQDEQVLKEWHYQDPPDKWEIARNDFVQSEQGNRNPFVDHPDWVCYFNFSTMEYLPSPELPCAGQGNSITEASFGTVRLYPNPTDGLITIVLDMRQAEALTLEVLDMTGRVAQAFRVRAGTGISQQVLDMGPLASGIYTLSVSNGDGRLMRRVVRD